RRTRTSTTSPAIATSSSPHSWEIGISSTARSYLRGRCSRTSRTVSIPSARSRLASEAPTPGSVVTGSASMRSGAVQPRGRGHSFWTTPAKPVCIRVIVATGTEDRTGTGRTLRDRDLDPRARSEPLEPRCRFEALERGARRGAQRLGLVGQAAGEQRFGVLEPHHREVELEAEPREACLRETEVAVDTCELPAQHVDAGAEACGVRPKRRGE